jgi:diguanylate cyclase (GGDEF)-like protein
VGGDEFCVVPSVDSVTVALDIVERVRDKVGKLVLPATQLRGKLVAISAGVIWYERSSSGTPPQALYLEADRLLYQAKRRGRNRTVIATL